MCQTRFAKVHLVIDQAGQKVTPLEVDNLSG